MRGISAPGGTASEKLESESGDWGQEDLSASRRGAGDFALAREAWPACKPLPPAEQ